MHSWWARWTIATRSLPEWPEIFCASCSPFWTPPLDSCFRRGNSTESCCSLRTALVEGSGEDPVPAMRTGLLVPAQHRVIISLKSRSNWQLMWMVDESTTSPLCQLNDVGLSRNTSFNARRPCIPSHSRTAWNALPLDVKAALSLAAFQRKLQLPLFHALFPDDW